MVKKIQIKSLEYKHGFVGVSVEGKPLVSIHYNFDPETGPEGTVLSVCVGDDNFYYFNKEGKLIEHEDME